MAGEGGREIAAEGAENGEKREAVSVVKRVTGVTIVPFPRTGLFLGIPIPLVQRLCSLKKRHAAEVVTSPDSPVWVHQIRIDKARFKCQDSCPVDKHFLAPVLVGSIELAMLTLTLGACTVWSVRSLVTAAQVLSLSKSALFILFEIDQRSGSTFTIFD
jgi:hypothetical protein